MSDWRNNAVKDEYGNPDISLCKNCQCMTHTLIGNVCGKCKKPKHISMVFLRKQKMLLKTK